MTNYTDSTILNLKALLDHCIRNIILSKSRFSINTDLQPKCGLTIHTVLTISNKCTNCFKRETVQNTETRAFKSKIGQEKLNWGVGLQVSNDLRCYSHENSR